jgi:O-succinylbenzoic acid--CoA ligase
MAAIAPTAIVEDDGEVRSLHGGRPVEAGDAAVVATSGTTGEPKAVVHTHASIEASALATSAALDVDPADDRWLACLPLAHIGGLAVVMRSLVTGTEVEVHDRFDPIAVGRAARDGATLVSLVTRALSQVRADSFRRIIIGGAAPPPDRPANVIATYGMTETGSGAVYDRAPLDGLELAIDASPNEDGDPSGEVLLRGPMLFRGYRHDPDPFTDGWFATGDIGRLDDGLLTIHGRRDDAIVTGGEKMWPARAEAILAKLESVAELAIVGRPDPEWGHRVEAVVVPTDPTAPPTLAELQEAVTGTLPVWYRPRDLELRDELPKTSLGKVKRDAL